MRPADGPMRRVKAARPDRTTASLVRKGAVVLVLAILLFGFGIAYERYRLLNDVAAAFAQKSRLIEDHLQSRLQGVDAMARLIEEQYREARPDFRANVASRVDRGFWQLETVVLGGKRLRPGGSGKGALPWSPTLEREVAAVLAIDTNAASTLAYAREVPWVYYTSVRRWIYAFPPGAPQHSYFGPGLYAKPYWTTTAPDRNPLRRETLSSLYEDAYGRGYMITASSPVWVGDRFLGVVSMDLGMSVLQDLVTERNAAGEFLLVDRAGRIVARPGKFNLREGYSLPDGQGLQRWHRDGSEWTATPVAGGRLWLMHRLPMADLITQALMHSIPAALLLVLIGAVLVLGGRLRAAMAALAQQAWRDPLTRALNRRGLYEEAPTLRALASRQHKALAVVIFDVDYFKQVNDCYGHEQGDKVLKVLARGLVDNLRDYDVACRWGGEEFVVLMMLEPGDAVTAVDRLRTVVARAVAEEVLTSITVSAGMAFWGDDETLEAAVERADRQLYAAKTAGRNRLEIEPEVAAARNGANAA